MSRFKLLTTLTMFFLVAVIAPVSIASDACSTTAITARADVEASGLAPFKIESYYASPASTAIRHIDDHEQTVAVEGPIGWTRRNGKSSVGGAFEKTFALGHQFHALLLHFDTLNHNIRTSDAVAFNGSTHKAKTGDFAYGGTIHLIEGSRSERPLGLLLEIPDDKPIASTFSDWRKSDGTWLPYQVEIDDGLAVFAYKFSKIKLGDKSPLWFFDAIHTPDLDTVQIYRLHRKLLAAHCEGDAEMIADLSAPDTYIVSNGRAQHVSREDTLKQFKSVFETLEYEEYSDLVEPEIVVSEAGDIGWITAQIATKGRDRKSKKPFDDQWAWVMTVRNVDGQWLHAGNSASRVPSKVITENQED